ncbi:MAG: type IV secretory system conjugative DNA transfer family protein [Rhodopila sp.]|jgi:type IV secretion system protein VirD4
MREYDILLGRVGRQILSLPGTEHVELDARTGAGKGVSFVLPNCFAYPGSLVVLDIKGEAFRATAGHRASMGQDIYLFSPDARDGRSHRWDPFGGVQRESNDRFRQIARQASLLFPEHDQVGVAGNNAKFWDDVGRQAFTSVATIMAESPDEALTMGNMTQLFLREDIHQVLADKIAASRRAGRSYSQSAINGASDLIGGDTKLRGEIRKTVSTRINIWSQPQIAAVTATSDFDLRDLRRRPMTIYVSVSPANIQNLRPLLRLFFDQVINANTDATPEEDPTLCVQTLVMLDEFARLGRMDTLAQAAQYVRGYGLRMAFVVQSRAELRAIYGKDAAADILDNLGAEIIFGTADPELTKELEERLGDATVTITTRNRPRFLAWLNLSKHGEAEHPHRRPLMLDQEVAQMSPDEQIVIRAGMKPLKTQRLCWYSDPQFRDLVRPSPEIPELQIRVANDDGATKVRVAKDTAQQAAPAAKPARRAGPAIPTRKISP